MVEPRAALPALAAPQPERVRVSREGGALALSYRWFSPLLVFSLCFVVVWDGFLVFWYRTALSQSATATNPMIWFPLLHVAVGLGLTYSTLAGFCNRTLVTVGGGQIVVRHGPLPWIGNKDVAAADIRQLYREETRSYSRGGSRSKFHLSAVTSDNRLVRIIGNVPAADIALYLEQEIEKELGIEDRKVAGEMPK